MRPARNLGRVECRCVYVFTFPYSPRQVWRLSDASAPLSVGLAHSHEVTQANFSPDGKQIVSVSKDACVCVWNWFA